MQLTRTAHTDTRCFQQGRTKFLERGHKIEREYHLKVKVVAIPDATSS